MLFNEVTLTPYPGICMNLYQHELMDHYHRPRNRGPVAHAHFSSSALNPSCGDAVAYQGTLDQGKMIAEIGFTGKGCVISQAAASMLSERIKGMSVQEVMKLDKEYVLSLLGIQLGPTRLRCALLPLEALHQGIAEYILANK
jgi:nitrogen fixation NifU-like protein